MSSSETIPFPLDLGGGGREWGQEKWFEMEVSDIKCEGKMIINDLGEK